jgi:serine/threonine-protein kinase
MQPGMTLGHYEILSAIGKGGMGEVWKARDTKLGREVAIKTLPKEFARDPERLARFEREARLLAALNHPGIAAIYGLEESGGHRFLVLELVEGDTLSDRLQRGAIPVEETLKLALQIAEALEAAHEKGVIHRDLKPANIKVTPDGKVKVLDFGLAKAFAKDDGDVNLSDSPTLSMAATQHGFILGTAAYMSPEQARGEQVDKRADIWAYGVVLHEMLTGKRLFEGKTVSDTLASVLMKEPDLTGAPPHVRKLLRACLERDPKRRLRDVGEAWRLLEDGAIEVKPQPRSLAPRLAWITAGILAVVAGLAVWAPWRSEPEQHLVRLPFDATAAVTVPPGARISSLVLSPDATRLVYISGFDGRGGSGGLAPRGFRGGGGSLLIQRLDQPKAADAVELSNTEGAGPASFSPDSKWIAFSQLDKISKISVDGGAAVPLADVPGNFGIAWAEDSTILAGGNIGEKRGLWRIPNNGGPPDTLPWSMDETPVFRVYQILPGNKTALFVVYGSGLPFNADTASIEAVSLTDWSRKIVVRGGVSPHYLPSGHLVYMSRGTLWAVPFDPDKLETRGSAVPILDDVQFNGGSGIANLSFSGNGALVYLQGTEVIPGFMNPLPARLDWIDASGKRSPFTARTAPFSRPRFSSDGKRLAISITEQASRDQWIYDLQQDRWTKITFGGLSITTPVFVAGGRYVVFGSGGDNRGVSGIYWTRSDGAGQPEVLIDIRGIPFVWSYSAALKRVAYHTGNTNSQIYTFPVTEESGQLNAGQPELFFQSQFSEQMPSFSPDGRWLAYATNKSGRNEVKVRAFPPPPSGQAAEWPVSVNGGDNPHWLPTTNELLYQTGDEIMSVRYTVKGGEFLVDQPRVRVDKLDRRASQNWGWDLSPDGRIAALTSIETAEPEPKPAVVFLLNFFDELRRRVPLD